MGDCPSGSKVDGDRLSATNLETQWNVEFNSFNSIDTNILKKGSNNLSVYVDYLASISGTTIPTTTISSLQTSTPKYILDLEDFRRLLTFYTSTNAPPASDTTRQELEQRNSKFITHVAKEYNFYLCRYKSMLTQYKAVFDTQTEPTTTTFGYMAAITSGASPISVRTNTLNNIANRVATVGRKLTLLSALLQKVGETMSGIIDTVSSNTTNSTALTNAIQALNNSAPTADAVAQLEAQRRALQYTQEKNRFSNLYLGIYAFLNITALAVLLHIASSD
jgi:hypothetical protein